MNRPGWLLKAVAAALILYGLVLVAGGVRDRLRRGGDEVDPEPEPTGLDVVAAHPPACTPCGPAPSHTAARRGRCSWWGPVLALSLVSRRSR